MTVFRIAVGQRHQAPNFVIAGRGRPKHRRSEVVEDHWPTPDDLGVVVLLPGREAGILTSWWHAPDHSEWRWTLELSNRQAAPATAQQDVLTGR